jgi:hypothetical protein
VRLGLKGHRGENQGAGEERDACGLQPGREQQGHQLDFA